MAEVEFWQVIDGRNSRVASTFAGRDLAPGMVVGCYCDAFSWVCDEWSGVFEQNLYVVHRPLKGGEGARLIDIRDHPEPIHLLLCHKRERVPHGTQLTLGREGRVRAAEAGDPVIAMAHTTQPGWRDAGAVFASFTVFWDKKPPEETML